MALRSPAILSICTGAGGLDLGVKLARPDARTVCYVEREAFAVANLVAAIQHGIMDDAPIWSDLRTFRGKPWRGQVDWLVGGIPCQPHSTAGKRLGAGDERDLWPAAARIIQEVRPSGVFLENVPGIARYYHGRIKPDLRAMGYRIEEGLFSAAEVGAPQVRVRLFILAHSGSDGWGRGSAPAQGRPGHDQDAGLLLEGPGGELANANHGAGSAQLELQHHQRAKEPTGSHRGTLVDPGSPQFGVRHRRVDREVLPPGERDEGVQPPEPPGGDVADAVGQRLQGPHDLRGRLSQAGGSGEAVADRQSDGWGKGTGRSPAGRPQPAECGPNVPHADGYLQERVRRTEQEEPIPGLGGLFPPGPDDLESWARVLAEMPEAEPAFCREADGVAWWLDATSARTQRLAVLGNGVVPLVAAHAFRTLAARMKSE